MLISDWMKTDSADIMVRDLVTLAPEDTLAEAADVFLKKQVSGAPVVDETGQCIGVLSFNDLIRAAGSIAEQQAQAADAFFATTDLILPTRVYDEKIAEIEGHLDDTGQQPVRRFMVTDLVTVAESDPISKIVNRFIDAHIHRVLVTGENGELRGIVSTIDVLASLVRIPV